LSDETRAARRVAVGVTWPSEDDDVADSVHASVAHSSEGDEDGADDLRGGAPPPWTCLDAIECFRLLRDADACAVAVDVRPRRDHDREAIAGSVSAPAATLSGGVSDRVVTPCVDGMASTLRELGVDASRPVVVIHPGDDDGAKYAAAALRRLVSEGYVRVVEMRGGIKAWLKYYTPSGKPRPRYVGYGKDNEETFWTASN
jgi:rhodanese-related sulfurtransferase|tara:strand:- start:1314 stop:1916 length:603 start_codon:yes stop_codon:yes gene_type:complete